jgi:hypothetical protein
MGRPPIGTVAMTSAERVRRHRLLHPAAKPVRPEVAEIAALTAQIEE